MKIYIGHSNNFDFKNELYKPIIESYLNSKFDFVFPHKDSKTLFNSKEFLKKEANLMIAEISYPSTGLGIELGWANNFNVPIICFYKTKSYSNSINAVTKNIIKYSNEKNLILKIEKEISEVIKK